MELETISDTLMSEITQIMDLEKVYTPSRLAVRMGISIVTAHSALEILASKGQVVTKPNPHYDPEYFLEQDQLTYIKKD